MQLIWHGIIGAIGFTIGTLLGGIIAQESLNHVPTYPQNPLVRAYYQHLLSHELD